MLRQLGRTSPDPGGETIRFCPAGHNTKNTSARRAEQRFSRRFPRLFIFVRRAKAAIRDSVAVAGPSVHLDAWEAGQAGGAKCSLSDQTKGAIGQAAQLSRPGEMFAYLHLAKWNELLRG